VLEDALWTGSSLAAQGGEIVASPPLVSATRSEALRSGTGLYTPTSSDTVALADSGLGGPGAAKSQPDKVVTCAWPPTCIGFRSHFF
jgi:hypothetical protein